MVDVALTVRYWAAAAEATGTDTERYVVSTVAQALALAGERHPQLGGVLPRCSLLLDGVRVSDPSREVLEDQILEVLPPFAGG